MAIMGFGDDFMFPEGMGMSMRYQMVVDSVSPIFSTVCASVLRDMVGGT